MLHPQGFHPWVHHLDLDPVGSKEMTVFLSGWQQKLFALLGSTCTRIVSLHNPIARAVSAMRTTELPTTQYLQRESDPAIPLDPRFQIREMQVVFYLQAANLLHVGIHLL